MKKYLVLISLFIAVSVCLSAEEFLIDVGSNYPSGDNWNNLGATGTLDGLLDNETGTSSTVNIAVAGSFSNYQNPSSWTIGDYDWLNDDTCDDLFYSSDENNYTTFTISNLSEGDYTVQVVSYFENTEHVGDYMVNGSFAQSSHLNPVDPDCSNDWAMLADATGPVNWMIWDNVAPEDGEIVISAIAEVVSGGIWAINAIRITSNDGSLPVELSSFSALQNESDFAEIQWITQSETEQAGFNILKSESENNDEAVKVNSSIIAAANTASGSEYSFTDVDVDFDNTYYYWLESVSLDNNVKLYGPVSITISRDKDDNVPDAEYTDMISAVYPNPFNPETNIDFSIKATGNVTLEVYNLKGQRVKTLVNNTVEAGEHSITWYGDTDSGNNASTGVYFIKLQTSEYQQIKKVMMIK